MNKKGFTLVEVLIVVVIIAILAALIVPRFLGQSERAYIAEAQQMLGAMRRGQQNYMSTMSTTTGIACAGNCTAANFSQMGMSAPSAVSSYSYTCTAGLGTGACTATRIGGGGYAGSQVTLQYNGATDGQFSCVGNYTLLTVKTGCTA